MWTLDELVDRVRLALAAEYSGAPNNRVRDLPDRRAIRWYTTIGLVDRPLGMRGRAALYGPRHLLQLVALKRRQAEGRALAEIQAELAGASDAALAGVARVPQELLTTDGPGADADAGPVRARFWAAPDAPAPVAAAAAAPTAAGAPAAVTEPGTAAAAPVAAGTPAAALDAAAPAAATAPVGAGTPAAAPVAKPDAAPAADAARAKGRRSAAPPPPPPVGGVALGRGAILMVPGLPTDADRSAIATAARPLMALLADRGLLNTENGSPS